MLPAVAGRPRTFRRFGPRQRVVAPFAGESVRAGQQATVGDDATANTRAEYHRERDRGACRRAVGRFGEGKAVGVVGHAHRPPQCGGEVAFQWFAVQAGGVGVLDVAAAGQ